MATLVFDFCSTLIDTETLELLAEEALRERSDRDEVLRAFQEITNQGMNGDITLQESFRKRFLLLGLTQRHVDAVTESIVGRIGVSVARTAPLFRAHAADIYIVSGGFTECILPVATFLGIDASHIFANRFILDPERNVLVCDPTLPTAQSNGKRTSIESLRAHTPLVPPVIIVGDGMTDVEAKGVGGADSFCAYTENVARPKVVALGDTVAHTMEEVFSFAHMA